MDKIFHKASGIVKENYRNRYWFIPLVILILWTLDALFSLFNTGFVRIDPWVIVSMLCKCCIAGCNLYFIVHLFFLKNKKMYYRFKTYLGYSIIAVYVTYAFPRMSWELAGLITDSRAVLLYIFNFISTLYPFSLYIFFWLEKTQRAWEVETEKELKALRKNKNGQNQPARKISAILIENIHVILQAFIIVILIQHFLFQLYVIPSESMVPAILTGDRPFVTKLQSGPSIPLTDWKFPVLKKPSRGNIVVFENPHYYQNSLFKKIFHHFVFLATLSLVDIDRDEQGDVRKRFIVKRVIGEPGDKLMMIDDAVYLKRKHDEDFSLLTEDAERFSHINLFDESPDIVNQIHNIILSRKTRELLDRWDMRKNNESVQGLKDNISEIVTIIRDKLENRHLTAEDRYLLFLRCRQQTKINEGNMEARGFHIPSYLYFQNNLQKANELAYLASLENENEVNVFYKYLEHYNKPAGKDTASLSHYEINGRKLNLIYEQLILKKFLRYCELTTRDTHIVDVYNDNTLFPVIRDIAEFFIYIRYYDYRNFPEFPQGKDTYIPGGSYFLMGDNRYNSLDFRYSQDRYYFRKIDTTDPFSFIYPSHLDPYLLKEEKILGIVAGRLWPLQRFGIIH